jgi:hypothetical protein
MRKLFTLRNICILALAVIGLMMLGIFSQVENWQRDLSINYASLDAESEDSRLHPPVLSESTSELATRIVAWAEDQSLWSVESEQVSDQEATIHLTRTTRIFRWVDDIHVVLSSVNGGVRLDAESKSRTGKADFGQNPRNLRDLLAGIKSVAR